MFSVCLLHLTMLICSLCAAREAGDFALKHASWMVGSQYKPAEVARSDWEAVQQGPPWAVDSWGLGCMMQVGRAVTCIYVIATCWLVEAADRWASQHWQLQGDSLTAQLQHIWHVVCHCSCRWISAAAAVTDVW